ncbi:MAG: hypothetical protein Q9219_002299 [cf. Caloplaca sp. 3 TL-2023]
MHPLGHPLGQSLSFLGRSETPLAVAFSHSCRYWSPTGEHKLSLPLSTLYMHRPASRSTAHRTGLPINALDVSPTRTHAILAGREILKTVHVTESACTEDFNLRSSIIAYAAAHDSTGGTISARHKDQLAATDVKWSHGKYDTTIATAAANGQIVIYDINRPGVELARLHEHSRQVHRIVFNPFQGALLLSGSQDATIRLWDLRALARDESVMTCRSVHKYPGNNEGIRDLRWSPTEGVEFAAGTDNGVIQRWELQKPNVPLLKLNAHEKTCYSIDWHPDGKHLASGGADKNIKIWDFSSTDRRMKSCWQLRAPKPIFHVRWRAPIWKSGEAAPGHWNSTQLATSYDIQDPRIHVWDLRRPSVPSKELDRFESTTTAMLWQSANLLWSVDIAGNFFQTNINLLDRPSKKRSPGTVAVASDGRLTSFLERKPKRYLSPEGLGRNMSHKNHHGGSGEKLSCSYSATDGSFEESSLLSSSFKARRRRPPSTQSFRSLAGTPPSAESGGQVTHLNEALQEANLFRSAQSAAYGRIGGLFDADVFIFLACRYYFEVPHRPRQGETILQSLPQAIRLHADLAGYAGQYRLAQSWRIVALALQKELEARLARNSLRQAQRSHQPPAFTAKDHDWSKGKVINGASDIQSSKINRPESTSYSMKQSEAMSLANESNVATPLVRPVSDASSELCIPATNNNIDEPDALTLTEPTFAKRSPQKSTGKVSALSKLRSPSDDDDLEETDTRLDNLSLQSEEASRTAERASPVGEFDRTDSQTHQKHAAKENYRTTSRRLLRLEDSIQTTERNALAPRFDRHDSNESFQMFSASTDSSHRARSMAGSFESSQSLERGFVTPQRWNDNNPVSDFRDIQPSKSTTRESDYTVQPGAAQLTDGRPLERPTSETRILHPEDAIIPDANLKSEDRREAEQEEDVYNDTDFLPSPNDPPPVPWTATAMVRPLIDYHLEQLSDVQLPTHLLLLLDPYIKHNIPTTLTTSVFISYHSQLVSLSLYAQAAQLRKAAAFRCTEIAEHGTYGIISGGPWCTTCKKSSKGNRRGFCSRCQEHWGDCPVCAGEGPAAFSEGYDVGVTSAVADETQRSGDDLWGWCQDCGHGGHVGCLRIWWDDMEGSEGGCPTLGCLHDCVPGARRSEFLQRKAENKKASAVKGDAWLVGESRAVEKTRHLIKGDEMERIVVQDRSHTRSLRGSRGPLSMAATGRTSSGGKKVRLLVPELESSTGGGADGARDENKTSASAPS